MSQPNFSTLAPYSERSSVNAREYIEIIFSDPENQLPPDELIAIYNFGHQLYGGEVNGISCESDLSLEAIRQQTVTDNTQNFYLGYFKSGAGMRDLKKLGVDQIDTIQVADVLLDTDYVNARLNKKDRKLIANRSLKWYRAKLGRDLRRSSRNDPNFIDEEPLRVNYEPNMLLDKISDLLAHRRFFRKIRGALYEERFNSFNFASAKHSLLDIYVSRVTSQLADLYPDAISLGRQLAASESSEQTETWNQRLAEVTPLLSRAFARHAAQNSEDMEVYEADFARRLDFLKHGAEAQENGEFSPISNELLQLVGELSQESQAPETPDQIFTPEVKKILDAIRWDAGQVKDFMEALLDEWSLLSKHDATWEAIEERDGFADDGKWQVAVRPRETSVSTSGAKRVVWIPHSFDRTLVQLAPAGVLPLLAHESEHVLQEQYNYLIAEQLPIARTINKRVLTLQEAGAVYEERKMQAMLGSSRPNNLHYLRTLQTKLAGGNKLQAIRTYLDSRNQGKNLTHKQATTSRKTAIGAASRLYRHSGYNTQPLDYIEQELVVSHLRQLSDDKAEVLITSATAFSLYDLARLHSFGLLILPDKLPCSPAVDVMCLFNEKYLPGILEKHAQKTT